VEAITNRKAPSGISRKPTATTSMASCFFCRLVMIAQEHLGFGVCVMPNEIVGLGANASSASHRCAISFNRGIESYIFGCP
jgi:hypothetical protein